MAGIKIINILKDDSFPEILEVFRHAPVGEVIFVLPKNGRIFSREDHFAAFASEATTAGKTISILSNNPAINSWSRKYKFNVMSASKPVAATKVDRTPVQKAVLASSPPPRDDDIRDESMDAFQDKDDVVGTSDETMEIPSEKDADRELEGFHIEDADGPVDTDADGDGLVDRPKEDDVTYGETAGFVAAPEMEPQVLLASSVDGVRRGVPRTNAVVASHREPVAAVPVDRGDQDYIDAMWRDRAGRAVVAQEPIRRRVSVAGHWSRIVATVKAMSSSVSSSGISKRVATGILAASAVLLGAIIYMTTGSAHVLVTPIGRAVDTQFSVQASDVFSAVDPNFAKIPGQLLQISKTASHEVPATGQRDVASKSRGTITVSNMFSSTPQTLIATTRFESSDGLIYRTLQTVTVPGSTVQNGQAVAGTVSVQVVADKPGAQYDIPAGTFGIPAFKEKGDTDRYAKFVGKSTAAFSGGANGPSKVVTQADYDAAKDAAVKEVKEQIQTSFAEQSTGLMILDGVEPAIGEITSTAQPDDAAEKVTVTVTGTMKTVAFRKDNLDELVTATLLKKEHLTVLTDQVKLKYTDIAFKPDLGVLVFTVGVKGTGYAPVDQTAIIGEIKGKSGTEIRDYFRDREGVESATVVLSPFWVRSVPDSTARIDLKFNYKPQDE